MESYLDKLLSQIRCKKARPYIADEIRGHLPFFSVGRSNMVLCYALVGFVMSIYRYKDVYPRHVNTTQVEFEKKLTIKISL